MRVNKYAETSWKALGTSKGVRIDFIRDLGSLVCLCSSSSSLFDDLPDIRAIILAAYPVGACGR